MSTPIYSSQSKSSKLLKFFEVNFLFKGLINIFKVVDSLPKRAFDFIVALVGLIILSPFFVFIGILIKRDTPGSIFYWGPRVGKNGRVFKMLKFRTMHECMETYRGLRVTSKDDPRITPLGAWLRETKINELPQLWNVLIGEMSLVGPRPEDPEIIKSWPSEERAKILAIKPGITSPASVLYHDEEKLLSTKNTMSEYFASILPDKIRLDLLYVRHHSFFSDLDTILWTLAILIPRWARTTIPAGDIFSGPFSRLGNWYISWFVIDLLESLGAIATVTLLWRTRLPLNWGVELISILAITWALLFSGFNSMAGLNRIVWSQATVEDGVGLFISGGFVTILVLGFNFLAPKFHGVNIPSLPITMIIVIGLITQICFICSRYRLRVITMIASRWLTLRQNTLAIGERILIVGDGEASQIANWLLGRQVFRTAFSIVGMVNDNDPTKLGMRVNGCWLLGTISDIPALVRKYDIGVILSTITAAEKEANEYIFDLCQENNLRLLFLNDLLLMIDRQVTQPLGSFEYPVWLDERLEFKAMHDAITGLPNRYLLHDRLKRSLTYAKRYNTRLAVMFISLDGLNNTNDKFGRKIRDQALIEVTKRLSRCKRDSDTLAYIRENRFALILENISDAGTTQVVTNRIHTSLSEPITVEKYEIHISAEITIYLDSEGYDDLEKICQTEIKGAIAH
jgi:diguanylate cyclase (GGDEF)-like protein